MNNQKTATTAERLKVAMEAKGFRQTDVLEAAKLYSKLFGGAVKLQKNDLSQYCSGKVEPRQDKLTLLGAVLDVSEPWLMGYDVPMKKDIVPVVESGDPLLRELIQLFNLMDASQRRLLLRLAKGLVSDE